MSDKTNHFADLASVNVNDKIEKKNGLSYLSWAWAVDQLLRNDPSASWSYGEPVRWGETVMMSCTVTAFGKPMTMQLPVMDHRNKPIPNPDAFSVNTCMQRCLVKAIALHGLGLYIYAGEDLPPGEDPDALTSQQAADLSKYFVEGNETLKKAMEYYKTTDINALTSAQAQLILTKINGAKK